MKKKHITVGILAHVDAGKTTLAESILYFAGNLRNLGRVDHGNTFMDHFDLEKERGITIFSKQAEVQLNHMSFTLLDTPGHVDFSAEMERTLQVLDYAILVIGGMDGVQGHVQTLWKLLEQYQIPTFIFVNKMDQNGADKAWIQSQLQSRLSANCIDFSTSKNSEAFIEAIAECDETLMDLYFENVPLTEEHIRNAIFNRNIFPCFYGSALKMQGVDTFIEQLEIYTKEKLYGDTFGAKVFKISRDKNGNRLTHLKITSGVLKVKESMNETEKIDQIRLYSGIAYETLPEISAGHICTVTGLQTTHIGDGLGIEAHSKPPILVPLLSYRITLPEGSDVHGMYLKLKQLEEEQPELSIQWNAQLGEIHALVMGDIQIEILKTLIAERFGINVDFQNGNIVYKETLVQRTEGAGHYEPLRHYAEVRLVLEPLSRGEGLVFESNVSEDVLDKNWQRLIMTHLKEKKHIGVLTGSEITDIKMIITNGRAHNKHTEGGDFRQATYRAVRQGLKKAESILLEPYYSFRIEVPSEMIGRAMTDIQKMCGTFDAPLQENEFSILLGEAPVSTMRNYHRELLSYTKGLGRLSLEYIGYRPCHNTEEVIASIGYDSEHDLDNPTGSVFCDHGSGFLVPWNEVEEYMHTECSIKKAKDYSISSCVTEPIITTEEIDRIIAKTFYANQKEDISPRTVVASTTLSRPQKIVSKKEILLVDGYNIIFAWEELKSLAESNIDGARGKLMDILCNYQGYKKNIVILVFDGYKVPGNIGEVSKYHNLYVVYTKEAETADQYIEKTVHDISKKFDVRVATSDAMEQMIIMGQGARRVSANELREEIFLLNAEIKEAYLTKSGKSSTYLFDVLPESMIDFLDDVRMGRREFDEINHSKEESK